MKACNKEDFFYDFWANSRIEESLWLRPERGRLKRYWSEPRCPPWLRAAWENGQRQRPQRHFLQVAKDFCWASSRYVPRDWNATFNPMWLSQKGNIEGVENVTSRSTPRHEQQHWSRNRYGSSWFPTYPPRPYQWITEKVSGDIIVLAEPPARTRLSDYLDGRHASRFARTQGHQ
jgi:hypothetical protein